MPESNTSWWLKISLELLWWYASLAIIFLVLQPIVSNAPSFPLLLQNALVIFCFITFTRYIFLLKHTFLAKNIWIQAFLILVSLGLILTMIKMLNQFSTHLDETGLSAELKHLDYSHQKSLGRYIRFEYIFFGIGSVIGAIVLPFRLIRNVWKIINS